MQNIPDRKPIRKTQYTRKTRTLIKQHKRLNRRPRNQFKLIFGNIRSAISLDGASKRHTSRQNSEPERHENTGGTEVHKRTKNDRNRKSRC